jgi:hypothetical protein
MIGGLLLQVHTLAHPLLNGVGGHIAGLEDRRKRIPACATAPLPMPARCDVQRHAKSRHETAAVRPLLFRLLTRIAAIDSDVGSIGRRSWLKRDGIVAAPAMSSLSESARPTKTRSPPRLPFSLIPLLQMRLPTPTGHRRGASRSSQQRAEMRFDAAARLRLGQSDRWSHDAARMRRTPSGTARQAEKRIFAAPRPITVECICRNSLAGVRPAGGSYLALLADPGGWPPSKTITRLE